MISGLQPYPDYKNTALPWLQEVPSHWECHRLRRLASVRLSNVDKSKDEYEMPVKLCNYVDVYYNDYISSNMVFMEGTANASEIESFQLRSNDVLITKDSEDWKDIAVASFVPETLENVICGYHLAIIRPNAEAILGEYLSRAFSAEPVGIQFRVAANGVTRYGLSLEGIKSAFFPVPPIVEQERIVAYIRHFDRRVVKYIRNRQRLIELLNEQKQTIINKAVTRGLNPNAQLKTSGIDWLGEIPEHWEVKPLKSTIAGYRQGVWGKEPTGDNDIACIRVANFNYEVFRVDKEYLTMRSVRKKELHNRLLRHGNLLLEVSGGGEKQPVGRVVLFDGECSAVCSNFIARIDVAGDFCAEFLTYLNAALYSFGLNIRSIKQTTGIQNISVSNYLREPVAIPPFNEQREIADFLTREIETFVNAVHKFEREIELMREYRTRLIADVVTGKVDVRGFASDIDEDESRIDNEIMEAIAGEDEILDADKPVEAEELADAGD
jgi:type I restriction enzyme, S subunit